jgi:putative IMPACT (imprinted ancient) family translation regulator
LRSGYSEYQKYSNILASAGAIIDDTDFGADVCVKFALKRDEAEKVLQRISEAGYGRDIPALVGERFDCR